MRSVNFVIIAWAAYAQASSHLLPALRQSEQPAAILHSAETMDVRQYGAVGDGIADDTVPLAKAFAEACTAGKRFVYVPRGTFVFNPSVAKLEICSNETVYGPGTVRVNAESGVYAYIFGPRPLTKAVDNFTMEGITVDQNAYKSSAAAVPGTAERSLLVVAVYAGTKLTFHRLSIYANGVNTISANGPEVHDVTVDQCSFRFQKHASVAPFDNSTIYINGSSFRVTNNIFLANKDDAAGTAIEVHEGGGTVTGNKVSWYSVAGNLVDTKALTVSSNVVHNSSLGFQLWALKGKSTDHNTISNNTIELNQVTRDAQASSGIATYFGNGIVGDHANVSITNNRITFQPEGAGRKVAVYSNFGIGLQCLGNIKGALISKNMIKYPPVRGIKIGINAKNVATANVTVVDNSIVDAGGNTEATAKEYSAAIGLEGNLTDVKVFNNIITFVSPSRGAKYSMYSNEKDYEFNGVLVFDNIIKSASREPVDGLTAGVKRALADK